MVDGVRWTILPIYCLMGCVKEVGKIILYEFLFLIEFQADDHINHKHQTPML
jgi:hypothetical protein